MAVSLLQSPLFSALPNLIHGFTTRHGGVSEGPFASLNLGWSTGDDEDVVEENYKRLAAQADIRPESFTGARQVHGGDALRVTSKDSKQDLRRADADALVTDEAGIVLAVRVADCFPVLLADPVRRSVAAVHAGWRGTLARVLPNAVERMTQEFGSTPDELRVAIGPGIGICCFEVALGVSALFEQDLDVKGKEMKAKEISAYLDLSEISARLARESGVRADRIWQSRECTRCNAQKYFSYRREGKKSGRQIGFIGLKGTTG